MFSEKCFSESQFNCLNTVRAVFHVVSYPHKLNSGLKELKTAINAKLTGLYNRIRVHKRFFAIKSVSRANLAYFYKGKVGSVEGERSLR